MKDCIKCGMICLGIGMVIGGVVVAKNKKLASKINDLTNKAEEKFNEVKNDVEDKIEEAKQNMEEKEVEKAQEEKAEAEAILSQSKKTSKKKN